MLHCTGWPPVKGWKWTREVNASQCWEKKPTGKSGEVVRQAVGGCGGRSDNYCMAGKK